MLGARRDKADLSGWMQITIGRKIQAYSLSLVKKTGHRGVEKDLEQGSGRAGFRFSCHFNFLTYFIIILYYYFLRGKGQREREGENPNQALC